MFQGEASVKMGRKWIKEEKVYGMISMENMAVLPLPLGYDGNSNN